MKYFKFALFFFFINSFFGQSAQSHDDVVLDTTTEIPTTNSSAPGNNLCNGTECDPFAFCDMSNGTARCQCYGSYTGDGTFCTDLNECETDNGGCPQTCVNDFGGFFCQCFDEYTGDGFDCTPLNTTTDLPTTTSSTPGNNLCNGTECHYYAYCDMSNGTAECQCYDGLTGDGLDCTDLDECSFNNSGCPQRCMNSFGSYLCQCFDGYTGDGFNCTQLPSVNFTTTTRPFTFPTTPETNFTTPFTNTTSSPPNNTGPFVPNIVCPSSYLQCSYRAAWLCDYIQWKIDFVGLFLPSFDEWRQWDVLSGGYYSTTYFPCDYISVTCRNPYQYDYFHGPNYCHIPYCRDGYYEDVSANNLHSWIQDQYRWRSIYNSYRQLLVSSRNRCRP